MIQQITPEQAQAELDRRRKPTVTPDQAAAELQRRGLEPPPLPPGATRFDEQVARPAPGADFPPTEVDVTGGRNPFMRGLGETQFDTAEELNAYAQERFGAGSRIARGSEIPNAQFERPEFADSWYLRRGLEDKWELYDPSAEHAARLWRGDSGGLVGAARGAAGFLAERMGGELVEQGVPMAPELALEGALLAGTRNPASGYAALQNVVRSRLGRAGLSAGAAAGATSLSDMAQQYYQTQEGLQRQTPEEQREQAAVSAAFAGVGSVGGDALSFMLGRGRGTLLGRLGEEEEQVLDAWRELADLAETGGADAETLERLSNGPLWAALSDAPAARRVISYLGRLTPEINNYQQQLRKALDELTQKQAEIPEGSPRELRQGLERAQRATEEEIRRASRLGSVEEAGMAMGATLGAYRDQMSAHFRELYEQADAAMPRDFDVQYNTEPLRQAMLDANARRTLQYESVAREGDIPNVRSETRRMEAGSRQAWSTYSEIEQRLVNMINGSERHSPSGLVHMVRQINDELAHAEIDDGARAALASLKGALIKTLESVPDLNPNIPEASIRRYLSANEEYRAYQQSLDTYGVLTALGQDQSRNFYRMASDLYSEGNPSRLRHIRDVMLEEKNGAEAWDDFRYAYLAYALDRPGGAVDGWVSMGDEARRMLFPSPKEADQFRSMLNNLDAVRATLDHRRLDDMYGETDDFVSRIVQEGATGEINPQRIRYLGEALDASGADARIGFEGGVWRHLLRNSLTLDSEGHEIINPDSFSAGVRNLRDTGIFGVLSPEQRRNIVNMERVLPSANFDRLDDGTGLAAAAFAARLLDPDQAPGAIMELGFHRLNAMALISQNGSLLDMMRAKAARPLPTLGRLVGYLSADESRMSDAEYQEMLRALESPHALRTQQLGEAVRRTPR